MVLMGSYGDDETAMKIHDACETYGIACELRVTSAHKGPDSTLSVISEYEGLFTCRCLIYKICTDLNIWQQKSIYLLHQCFLPLALFRHMSECHFSLSKIVRLKRCVLNNVKYYARRHTISWIKVCRCLYALYGIWRHYTAAVSAWLGNGWKIILSCHD